MNKERLYEKLENYKRASKRLDEATKKQLDDDIVYDGVIQRFECTFELSWKFYILSTVVFLKKNRIGKQFY